MIVIINPNSTETMTFSMLETARTACPTAEFVAWTSHDGPASIQGPEDGEACLPPLMKLVAKASDQGARAIIIGCFDDTGLEAAQHLASCPVIGIGQAAYHIAAMSGPRFSVVTTLAVSIPVLRNRIEAYGLNGNLGKLRASGVPVLDLEENAHEATQRVLEEISRAQKEDDVQCVVLGCAGMSHIPHHAGAQVTVRLIDGVVAAAHVSAAL